MKGAADSAAIVVREEYSASPIIVNMDENEMKQVFINIINNALHAMPSGGQLLIHAGTTGQEAFIEFTDTGVGITQDNMKRIFEPFFSTKDTGAGTGLGLSISYRIIQNHGGRIEVESMPGGTTFAVFLPLHEKLPLLRAKYQTIPGEQS
jgi:two-component system NtrC family sensor kinase